MGTASIKKNFLMNAILTISGILFPMISFLYVARTIGPTGNGKVDFATSVVSYFALFAQLGIPTYGIRACAKVRDDRKALSRTVHELVTINLAMTLLAYIVFFPTIFLVPRFRADKTLLMIISITLLLNSLGIEYLYRAIEKYSYITIRSIAFKLLAFIPLFLLVKDESHYVIYGAITIFASSASNILNFIHARKYIDFKGFGKPNYKQHFKLVAMFFAMSCATTIYLNLDRLMLGFMVTDADVGYYGAAAKLKNILVQFVTSLGAVILPRASYYVENKLYDDFRRITQKALKFVFVVAVPLVVFFIIYAREGIMVVSGTKYLPAVPGMMVIMPTLLFIGITNILGIQVLLPLGKEKYVLYSEIAGAIIDLILNVIFIPSLKATGASLGTTVAEFVVLVVQLILIVKIKDIVPVYKMFGSIKYWKILLAVPIGVACSIWIKFVELPQVTDKVFINSMIRLALTGICFFIPYGIMMLICRDEMVIEMKNTAFGFLKKKVRKAD